MYVYCVVCYHVIADTYVRSVVMSLHTITLLTTIWNAQWIMSSLLLPKVIFLTYNMYKELSLYASPLILILMCL